MGVASGSNDRMVVAGVSTRGDLATRVKKIIIQSNSDNKYPLGKQKLVLSKQGTSYPC